MLFPLLILTTALARTLPDWAVERIDQAQQELGCPLVVAAGGPDATALSQEARSVLGANVVPLTGPDPMTALDALLAGGDPCCGFLLERGTTGTFSLRSRGSCSLGRRVAPAQPGPEPTPPTIPAPRQAPPPQLWLGPVPHGTAAYLGAERLDPDEFAHLVDDVQVQEAYARSMRPVRIVSISLAASTYPAMAVAYGSIAEPHWNEVTDADRRRAAALTGYAITAGMGALIYLAATKLRINRLSHWYDDVEAQERMDLYNASRPRGDEAGAPNTP
jgi:hypothetical protein